MDNELRAKLAEARSLDETKEILNGHEGLDAERVYQEIQRHRSMQSERLDLNELDAVNGGAARDWPTEGCAATCEESSWCWSNDACSIFDVVYDRFWWTDVHD